ncbi:MAG: hypothetical protein Q8O14_01800 [bacterium]|nr:hypothetical protein [bacterium]
MFESTSSSNDEKAQCLVEVVEHIGVEPFQPPDPLPPITEDEIHLITWMAITSGE